MDAFDVTIVAKNVVKVVVKIVVKIIVKIVVKIVLKIVVKIRVQLDPVKIVVMIVTVYNDRIGFEV